jgi:hypothetical protein
MTPEQQQALEEHIQAIAKILYEDTLPEQLTSLAGIEQAVRSQMQKHVMPEVEFFYHKCHRHSRRYPGGSRASSESCRSQANKPKG